MDIGYSFKWALIYRVIAVGALMLGAALVVLGFLAGFGGAVTTLVSDPLTPGSAIERANPAITLLFCVLGVIVWQVGKTYALFLTLPRAAGRAAARRFDSKRVADDVAGELDDRLAAMEAELADTRRELEELKRRSGEQVTSYDEHEHLDSSAADGDEATPTADPTDGTDTRPVPASASGSSDATDTGVETDVETPAPATPKTDESGDSSDSSTRNGDTSTGGSIRDAPTE